MRSGAFRVAARPNDNTTRSPHQHVSRLLKSLNQLVVERKSRISVTVLFGFSRHVTSYRLNNPAEVCIPLPAELRSRLDRLSVVATNENGLTALSSRVVLRADGNPQLCGNMSVLPAVIAAARFGAPSSLPVSVDPKDGEPETPDTGGRSTNIPLLLILLIVGAGSIALGLRSSTLSTNGGK